MHTRPPSADPGSNGAPDRDGAYNVRSVPVRIYLPEGPVLQDLVPPTLEDGERLTSFLFVFAIEVYMQTILVFLTSTFVRDRLGLTVLNTVGTVHRFSYFLTTHLPLLFPVSDTRHSDLAYALVQGVLVPPDAEMAWLGACMAGADGWVNVCVGLLQDGLRYQ